MQQIDSIWTGGKYNIQQAEMDDILLHSVRSMIFCYTDAPSTSQNNLEKTFEMK